MSTYRSCGGKRRGEMSQSADAISALREKGFVPIRGHEQYLCGKDGTIIGKRGQVMTGTVDRCGYRGVLLTENYRTSNCLVHRLILSTFNPVPGWESLQVNHINGIKTDNRLENLEWCTRSENLIHAYDTGLERRMTGTKHWAHKFNKEDIAYIRSHAISGHRQDNNIKELASKFNCDISIIRDVVARRSYCED